MINVFKEGERYYLDEQSVKELAKIKKFYMNAQGVKELAKIETVNVFKARIAENTPLVKEVKSEKPVWIRDQNGKPIGIK
jgi:hypothetical protein